MKSLQKTKFQILIFISHWLSPKKCEDLVYFVDYIHAENAMEEMVLTYERIASQINKELII